MSASTETAHRALESISKWQIPRSPLPVLILPHLVLGNRKSALDVLGLQKLGVTHLLDVGQTETNLANVDPGKYARKYIGTDAHVLEALPSALEFIDSARGVGKCLLFCDDQSDRSGTVAAAALMVSERMTVVEAARQCVLARGFILESDTDRSQLLRVASEQGLLEPIPPLSSIEAAPKPSDEDWARKTKWESFYAGSFAPHKPSKDVSPIDGLPWRYPGATPQLVSYLEQSPLMPAARCVELGCGTGENLLHMSAAGAAFVFGVDIVAAAVNTANAALASSGVSQGQVVRADAFTLPYAAVQPADGRGWGFDFMCDVQTFHCLRTIDETRAKQVYDAMLAPGGRLFMLTGNADEPVERGPNRMTRDEVMHAFDGTALQLEKMEAFRFAMTDTYRKQPYDEPPLGWLSIWRKPSRYELLVTALERRVRTPGFVMMLTAAAVGAAMVAMRAQ